MFSIYTKYEIQKNKYSKVELNNTEVRELVSSANGYKYNIYVKFPRFYEESDKKYSVFYIINAETNFGLYNGITFNHEEHKGHEENKSI